MSNENRLQSVLRAPVGQFRLVLLDTNGERENAFPQGDFPSLEVARDEKSSRLAKSQSSKYGIFDDAGKRVD